ncbi:sulfite exporter TauE/SafE family protein [Aquabacterium sp.]|uniref:sulfite exporter TauE/SafE family protein n=1 Tax=Aquabacterium sp. TaxID=1872578 RepID=UPI0024883D1A|nr:sulfite exporter TauE/SafE family protein [Aquabacterium sp.]MDI1257751.1 sulfite exporter TauE/SafE family protein [Aquabacterium sp.]
MLAILPLLTALLIGASLGFMGGVFGIGGGIIAVPLLVLGFGLDQPIAQGTALVLMAPNLLVGWWRYHQRHPMKWQAMSAIALSASLTTWLVAQVATRMDPLVLRVIFSVFMVVLALRLWHTAQHHQADAPPVERPLNLRVLPLVGMVGGCSMGLLGIGGGLMAGPLLSGWLGQRQTTAQGLSLALVAPSSVVALATYAGAHHVDWALGLPMAVGGVLTVSAGVALAHRLPERPMRLSFVAILMATALWLVAAPHG